MKSGNARRVSHVEESPRAFYRRAGGDSNRTAGVEGDSPLNRRGKHRVVERKTIDHGAMLYQVIDDVTNYDGGAVLWKR
jgi:hypothetical protein